MRDGSESITQISTLNRHVVIGSEVSIDNCKESLIAALLTLSISHFHLIVLLHPFGGHEILVEEKDEKEEEEEGILYWLKPIIILHKRGSAKITQT